MVFFFLAAGALKVGAAWCTVTEKLIAEENTQLLAVPAAFCLTELAGLPPQIGNPANGTDDEGQNFSPDLHMPGFIGTACHAGRYFRSFCNLFPAESGETGNYNKYINSVIGLQTVK